MVRKRSWQTSLKKLKCWTRKDERKERTPFGSGWIGFIAQGAGMQAFDNRASVETFQYDGLPVYEVKREAWWVQEAAALGAVAYHKNKRKSKRLF